MLIPLILVLAAGATELEATYDAVLAQDATPELRFRSLNFPAAVLVECEVAGRSLRWEFPEIEAGTMHKVPLPHQPDVTTAQCQVLARFANGHTQGVDVDMVWSYIQLDHEGNASDVSMDLAAQVAVLPAPFEAHQATVQALDSRGAVIFEEVIQLRPRAGRTTVRWTQQGAERASIMRFHLVGKHGEQVAYDMKIQREWR
jgi:hypothetical protein